MQQLQAFKFELRPDGQQERQMRRFAGSCRFVFNKALALQKERYEAAVALVMGVDRSVMLPVKKEGAELDERP
ncbi:helix-turn-helix domain-containing protein [Ectothiorhodospira lacustris]|uniref:helix-turn-helix domain-containing protein n=1 Tax=Ectothiorhodospira lacustris TaxID=2899127 RepID=UPI001EE86049|nr:helix-turn-helix domain-containing protein [Ectothiorhodospira lacustris]MCG5511062.1 helix-turn-helix domain-containing protein [Ectothiorhodospira lacustris]MCG5522792.1 helix-turn-helix domain-containing protein [Ectothiorhodospira lacustris]